MRSYDFDVQFPASDSGSAIGIQQMDYVYTLTAPKDVTLAEALVAAG